MYLINQVSKITGLTKKALRYYDEQQILTPSFRDKASQYRYYSEADIQKAQLIKQLKSLDFSISEIRDTVQMVENKEDLSYILKEKTELIQRHIAQEKALIKELNRLIELPSSSQAKKSYDIHIEEIPSILVASLSVTDAYHQIGNYIPHLFQAVKGNISGQLMNCYLDEDYTDPANMELCIPVKKIGSSLAVTYKQLPTVRALCTTHVGSYETLSQAYQALFHYANTHKLSILSPSREVYQKGPGMIFRGNPNQYVTKIILPILFL